MPKIGMEPSRRAEIINATLMCICDYGIEGTTLDKVAVKAKCSKGVAAYYFKNKNTLIIESFKAFLSYYGKKIEDDIKLGMSAAEMLAVTLEHSLPPETEERLMAEVEEEINVSDLLGHELMKISPSQKAILFVQFFSKASIDPIMQNVIVEAYKIDVNGIASIFHYGRAIGEFNGSSDESENQKSAYGLLAMVLGLSFFRVAGVKLATADLLEVDNREIAVDYALRLAGGHSINKK